MKYYILSTNQDLQHHGILGMKWGIRRYQNKDGSLTALGRKRLYKISNDNKIKNDNQTDDELREYTKKELNKYRKSESSSTDVLNKNIEFKRIANSDEKIDDRIKYVSMLKNDSEQYRSMMGLLNADLWKPMSEYTYSTDKNLKVYKTKIEDVINEIGDKKISDFYKDSIVLNKTNLDILTGKNDWIINYNNTINKEIVKAVEKTILSDDYIQNLAKKGYDAMIDPVDARWTDYPLIILNPKKTLKLKKEERI